ncbi:MAG: hypothetical protein AB7F99_02770 [Vicinamibacterales bacterium]
MTPLSLRQATMGVVIVAVISAVVAGILLLGSPADERMRRLDERRVNDLIALARATDVYWTRHDRLPESLDQLVQEPGSSVSEQDPGTGVPYEYAALDERTYEVCASFAQSATLVEHRLDGDFWTHGEGRQCFRREAQEVR